MSFRRLGKWFRSRKDSSEGKEIFLPADGFEKCIKMILAYTGQDISAMDSVKKEDNLERAYYLYNVSVLRYLGRGHALNGADPFEDLQIDRIVDVFIDFLNKIHALEREEDPETKERNLAAFNQQVASHYLAKLDAVIATNRGHLACSKITWADFLLACMWDNVKEVLEIVATHKFQNIEALVQHINTIPPVKSTLELIRSNEASV